jgi:carboxymethylenebutenolidase
MGSSWENVKVGDSSMRTYMSLPENSQPAPAVIVVQGQTGVDDFVEFSDMVAREGFVAAAPDLYHRDSADCKDDAPTRRMRLTDSTVIADINATVAFLQSLKSVDPARIGIIGFCMGGRAVSHVGGESGY